MSNIVKNRTVGNFALFLAGLVLAFNIASCRCKKDDPTPSLRATIGVKDANRTLKAHDKIVISLIRTDQLPKPVELKQVTLETFPGELASQFQGNWVEVNGQNFCHLTHQQQLQKGSTVKFDARAAKDFELDVNKIKVKYNNKEVKLDVVALPN